MEATAPKRVKIETIKPNEKNPRFIRDEKYKKLLASISAFPDMLLARPIIVDEYGVILGGNMRWRAAKELGHTHVNVVVVKGWTEEQKKEFIVKDNLSYGEWDFDMLSADYDFTVLDEWGLDIPDFNSEEVDEKQDENIYTKKIETPIYEPSGNKPLISELLSTSKYDLLIDSIMKSDLSEEEKKFLCLAATRHIVFDYSKIADFYAHSRKEVQLLMEDSALIIIDFNKAIEDGFVRLTNSIAEQYEKEYDDYEEEPNQN